MRHISLISLFLSTFLALAGCQNGGGNDTLAGVNVIDESNLNHIMLQAADPAEAVNYFTRASAQDPDRIDLQRGLAMALVRAGRAADATPIWARVTAHPDASHDDRVEYADTLIRTADWAAAEAELDKIPPTYETYKRYRLEAMIADSKGDWRKADSFYDIAAGMTTTPSGVYNNWGFSKLTRGDHAGAERLFAQAITYDPGLFTAKNNLVLARAAQRKYDLPLVSMTQTERAQLLHTAALSAIKQGDVATGRGLLVEAVETHPQHFDAAVRSLNALEANVTR
ncbi:MAG: tetratricopeptide repeat protein [Paracoccaceae bacterium]